ncbi:hypothetical protein R1flu_028936 [Riccia fluitans]|uniref:HpcH/HpaI aldolase/citrate lyase domain-containing protein n=1 Tax=Riccia fluitans TaxID=41844 RepID=A0ABD1XS60_9MARC
MTRSRGNGIVAPGMAEFFTESGDPPSLKSRLLNGEKLYGALSVSYSPVNAEILGWAGYDFVVVDMEHGPGDMFSALPVLRALNSARTPAIIRVPDNDEIYVKKALDLGPAGIMFPKVDNAEEARNAVASCRYPPYGIRGAAPPLIRASRYGLDSTYLETCEQDLLIMCQAESEEAVNNLQEITEVEGVDCVHFGPRDLRASMGLLRHPEDPRGLAMLKKGERAVLASGKKMLLGGFATPESSPAEMYDRGYNLVCGVVDVAMFRDAAVADLKKNKIKLKITR